MQTMPARTRTAVTVGAILLGVVIVGAIALYSSTRSKEPVAQEPGDSAASAEMAEGTQSGLAADPTAPDVTAEMSSATALANAPATGAIDATPESGLTAGTEPEVEGAALTAMAVPETYEVVPGDTLRGIAQHFYGDAVFAGDIEELNHLPDPDHLAVGKMLDMPRPESLHR